MTSKNEHIRVADIQIGQLCVNAREKNTYAVDYIDISESHTRRRICSFVERSWESDRNEQQTTSLTFEDCDTFTT